MLVGFFVMFLDLPRGEMQFLYSLLDYCSTV